MRIILNKVITRTKRYGIKYTAVKKRTVVIIIGFFFFVICILNQYFNFHRTQQIRPHTTLNRFYHTYYDIPK